MIRTLHSHKCGACSHVWEHMTPDTSKMSAAEGDKLYDEQHCCPICKTGPWTEKFYATEKDRENEKNAVFAQLDEMDPLEFVLTVVITALSAIRK